MLVKNMGTDLFTFPLFSIFICKIWFYPAWFHFDYFQLLSFW